MTADKDVEALRARVLREADNAAGRGVRLADMTFSVEGDTLVALCRRWLEATHCDNCGCDWLDNGLNPIGCPYCKESPAIGEETMVNAAHGVFTLPLPKPSVPLPKPSVPLPKPSVPLPKIGDQYFAAPQQPAMTDRKTDAPPQVIDFETFATMRGASRLDYCEDGAVSPAGHMPKSNWRRFYWWQLVFSDTLNRVCSRRKEPDNG